MKTKKVTPKKVIKKPKINLDEKIVIDKNSGLVFDSEKELFAYFKEMIADFEKQYQSAKIDGDFTEEEQAQLTSYLEPTLDEPDEIFLDETTYEDIEIFYFLKNFELEGQPLTYFVAAYIDQEEEQPTFVFTHYPTRYPEILEPYRQCDLIYNHQIADIALASIEGDSLGEGDELSVGLFESMLKLRTDKDIPIDKFGEMAELREETIEGADEIWRKTDIQGTVLVCFIKEFPDIQGGLFYVALTAEEPNESIHSLLFSFPTLDESLVDRYRQGENLQAEEVSQESSH